MSNYQIITDSGCDLPKSMADALSLTVSPLYVTFRGVTRPDSVDEDIQEMYAGLRSGDAATTSAINPQQWSDAIDAVLAKGMDALVLTFSSGLSTTYQSAIIAANELAEKYLSLFCRKSASDETCVRNWLPLVAASQSVKSNAEERKFLLGRVNVVNHP